MAYTVLPYAGTGFPQQQSYGEFGLSPDAANAISQQTHAYGRAMNAEYDAAAARSHQQYAQQAGALSYANMPLGNVTNSAVMRGDGSTTGGNTGAGYPGPAGGSGGNDAYLQSMLDSMNKQQAAAEKARLGAGQAAGQLLGEYSSAYKQARAANEQRYGDILGGYRARYGEAMNTVNQMSDQERRDIGSRYDQLGAKTDSSAISRGLFNTTVRDSLQRGVASDRSAELRRENDDATQRRLAVQLPASKEGLDFMERRTDEYPSLESMTQLALQAGAAGALPGGTNITGKGQAASGYNPQQSLTGMNAAGNPYYGNNTGGGPQGAATYGGGANLQQYGGQQGGSYGPPAGYGGQQQQQYGGQQGQQDPYASSFGQPGVRNAVGPYDVQRGAYAWDDRGAAAGTINENLPGYGLANRQQQPYQPVQQPQMLRGQMSGWDTDPNNRLSAAYQQLQGNYASGAPNNPNLTPDQQYKQNQMNALTAQANTGVIPKQAKATTGKGNPNKGWMISGAPNVNSMTGAYTNNLNKNTASWMQGANAQTANWMNQYGR